MKSVISCQASQGHVVETRVADFLAEHVVCIQGNALAAFEDGHIVDDGADKERETQGADGKEGAGQPQEHQPERHANDDRHEPRQQSCR